MALTHHVVAGTGSPPIVFVHGFGCSHTDWQAQIGHFSARHMTVAVDLPGHGATPALPEPGSIARCGLCVAELLRARRTAGRPRRAQHGLPRGARCGVARAGARGGHRPRRRQPVRGSGGAGL